MFSRTSESSRRRVGYLTAANLVLLIVIWGLLKEGASFGNVLTRCATDTAPMLLAALGLTAIIFTGAIDLSIGSILALGGTCFGILVVKGAPPWAAWLGCMAVVALLSGCNGLMVRYLRVPAIILTLAGLPFYRGVALMLADSMIPGFSGNISIQEAAFHSPGKLYPWLILAFGIAVAIWMEFRGRATRLWLALGGSEEACRLAGLSPGRLTTQAFWFGGVFLALGTLVYVTRVTAIEPSRMALGFELQVIGAVIIGGTNIFGGEGSFTGTLLGGLFLYLISQVLTYAEASPYLQEAITGMVIIGVIGLDCATQRRAKLLEELA